MDPRAPLTVDQVAQLLQCAPDTVREKAAAGELPGLKLGRDWVFPSGALFARLDVLATEGAAKRRDPAPAAAHVLHPVPPAPSSRRHTRRPPPALPQLGT